LRLAIGIASALSKAHQRGLVHKDLKPGHILVNCADGQVRLTGFGIASRLARERQALEPPETIAGTLAYMAPEQTGRMNRSIDSRSDLYSLGVTLYQMLTGSLPFAASDPMEWVHCHIARQPLAPRERLENVPAPVSQLVMKLLAKTAEERYQTAACVARDLRRCQADWERQRRIDDFSLGERDTPDRLFIPESLYGRERELEILLGSVDRVLKGGAPELAMVSGYSGIGKSSVVNELHKALVPPRGLFASGKFDQYKRDIPYSTLAQAFQSLIRRLLGKSDAELALWRDAFLEALEPNARLMTDLVPELKLIIGDQAPVPELEPQQAQSRFQLVFRRFIGVFARPDHPLALFLDDLQWLDEATLDLLGDLLTQSEVQHLLLIGAYRGNEVDATHPLTRKLDAIRQAGARVQEIRLAPLARKHIGQLIADALHCEPECAAPLAQLVHEKTDGNPFFVIQFLYALAEEGLLRFDYDATRWRWDLYRIHDKGYADNVVDLMVGKLTRLPVETRQALQQFACLGNAAAIATLSTVLGIPEAQVHAALWPAVRQELVERLKGSYKFMHDRVQEAAYSLIPDASRAEAHLRIGRLMVTQTPTEEREAAIFEIVNQLNRGAQLIAAPLEREQIAELNLIAGKRAKAATAYASALAYLNAGGAQLAEEWWERRHELIFALELNRAECEFLTGALAEAEERLSLLSTRAVNTVERASVACLLLDLYTTLGQSNRAVAVALEYLRHSGVDWSPHPTDEDVRREYERIWLQLGSRRIEDLIELPLITDPASLATMDVLTKIGVPAFFTERNLYDLATCGAVNLSLEQGNSDGSSDEYVRLGMIACARFGDYDAGLRFGQVGYEQAERRGLKRYQARTHMLCAAYLMPYTRHVRAARELLRRSFEIASKDGDLVFAGYSCHNLTENLLAAGDPLIEVQREAERGLEFARKARFGQLIDVITSQLGFIRMLRGLTRKFGSFDDEHFDEVRIEHYFSSDPDLAFAECWYWIRKLQAHFHAGDYASVTEAASRAQRHAQSRLLFAAADCHFYSALSGAALYYSALPDERQQHRDAVAAHHRQLQVWAENCTENFVNRAELVGAELARIEGRDVDAMSLYEQAIRSARDNGFVHHEAIAYERASDFYRARGFDQIADLYLCNARYAYVRWGADGKVRQLDQMYPNLKEEQPAPGPTSTMGAPVEHLDLATVIKVSKAVSSEIVLEKLVDTLMRTAIEQAGAERGLLILAREPEPRIAAEAVTGGNAVVVHLRDEPVTAAAMPQTVLHYVVRARESVILDDAAAQSPFADDPYIREREARSILCLPLINQAKLVGALYLENTLAPGVFAPTRIAALKLLASQAAMALENARLYHDLEQRQAKIRRLVDANIIGIAVAERDGRMIEANDAYLRIIGYDREDLLSGRIRWIDLTPLEWRDRSAEALSEFEITGAVQPFEKEYLRKDGSRVPVLVGVAGIDESENQRIAFVLDLTERKRAEKALRRSEAYLADAQKLSHTGSWARNIATGETTHSSEEHSRLFGFDPELGAPSFEAFAERIYPEDRATVAEAFERAIRERTDFEVDFRTALPDGTIKYIHGVGHPVFDAAGDLVEYVGTAVDVTESKRAEEERKRAEKALRESEEQWKAVFENNPTMYFMVNESGAIISVNPFGAEQLGFTVDELIGRPVQNLFHAEDQEAVEKNSTICFKRRGQTISWEARKIRKNGEVLWVREMARVMLVKDRPVALIVCEDITERRRVSEALREVQMELAHANRVATMGQLTASIAHEVNQPIAGAVTNAHAALRWLSAQPPDLEEVRQALARIVRDGGRAADVIDRIRELVKKAPLRKDGVAINEAIIEVVVLTHGEAMKNGVSVRTQLAEGLPPIEGDRVQLQQVILNLIINAIQAMSGMAEGARDLLISTGKAEPDGVLVAVRDSGPGLAPEALDRLFDAFYTSKPSGLGLGLSICRSIIEAHGGRLWATANLPRGAILQFTAPAHPAHS
jgi:PAS domain S-box-containing protein